MHTICDDRQHTASIANHNSTHLKGRVWSHQHSLGPRQGPTPAQIASSIMRRDTGSDPCWGWFGSGAETNSNIACQDPGVFNLSMIMERLINCLTDVNNIPWSLIIIGTCAYISTEGSIYVPISETRLISNDTPQTGNALHFAFFK